MATVKIWDIKNRIDKVINYVINKEKTFNVDYDERDIKDLHDVLDYTVDINKTEGKFFTTGINCDVETAYEDMIDTKSFFQKTDGILAFHAYQSFAKGETDAKTAHEIGIEFAKKMWGDKFEVVVATHCNTECFHNHFVINSVSYLTGEKYNDCKKNYALMREISDGLCREYNLSVIENPKKSTHQNYALYMAEKNGEWTKDAIIRRDIDECIASSISSKEFYIEMKKRGYSFEFKKKYPTISHPDFERKRRLKTLGYDYIPERIDARIMADWHTCKAQIPKQDDIIDEYFSNLKEPTYKEVYVTFVTVVKRVKNYPNQNREVDKFLIEEMQKLDKLIEQQNLLCDNDIETDEELLKFKTECQSELKEVVDVRDNLRILLKRAMRAGDDNRVNELKNDISLLTERAKILRKNIRIAKRIEENEPKIEQKIEQIKTDKQGKEMDKNERFRGRSRTSR